MIKMKTMLTCIIVISSILIFVSQIIINSYFLHNVVLLQINDLLQKHAEHEAAYINTKLSNFKKTSELIAHTIEVQDNNDTNYIFKIISLLIEEEPLLVGSGLWMQPYIFDSNQFYYGPYLYKDKDNNITITWDRSNSTYNYFNYDWYQKGFYTNETTKWSDPYTDDITQATLITASTPIYKDNQIIGVTTVDMNIKALERAISNSYVVKTGYAFILNNNGKYINNSNITIPFADNILNETDAGLIEVSNDILNGPFSGVSRVTIANQDVFVAYSNIGQTCLKLVLVYPSIEVYETAIKAFTFSIIALFLFLTILYTLLYKFLTNRVVAPLTQLTSAAVQLGNGNFDVTMPKNFINDEIGLLITSFEAMRRQLSHNISKLRTTNQELTLTQDKLSLQNEYLTTLYDTTLSILGHDNTHNLLHSILVRATKLLNCPNGHIVVIDQSSKKIATLLTQGVYTKIPKSKINLSEGLLGKVCRENQITLIPDYSTWTNRLADNIFNNIKAIVSVPLHFKNNVIGVITLAHTDDKTFSAEQIELLERFAKLTSLTLNNAILYNSLAKELAERKNNEAKITYLAYHDSILGLPNRNMLQIQLADSIKSKAIDDILAVFSLNIDGIDLVNDIAGLSAGDQLQRDLMQALQNISPDLFIAKMNGHEFNILIPHIKNQDQLHILAEKILAVCKQTWIINNQEFFLPSNIGISIYDNDDTESMLKHANLAMQQAQILGKNTYQIFTDTMLSERLDNLILGKELRAALDNTEFILYYQPRVDATTNKIVSLEALIRWQHPTKGLIPPIKFIPMAEESGLIIPIGNWVIKSACKQLKKWRAMGLNIDVSVNLSAVQFHQENLFSIIKGAIAEAAIDPAWLELEITETMYMQDIDFTITTLNEFKKLGVKISMDDFGTGQSSLVNLKRLPINTLKIDKSFIQDAEVSKESASIVQAIITLAHIMNLKATAEGVENNKQLALLKKYGCDELQGYLFSKPLPPEQIENLLLNSTDFTKL